MHINIHIKVFNAYKCLKETNHQMLPTVIVIIVKILEVSAI